MQQTLSIFAQKYTESVGSICIFIVLEEKAHICKDILSCKSHLLHAW